MNNSKANLMKTAICATAGLGLLCVVITQRTRIFNSLKRIWQKRDALSYKNINIIDNIDDCQNAINILKKQCNDLKVLGFDCEWVTVGGKRRSVALLQLASNEGTCALFRLCNMRQIPKSLRELLEDDNILKVGVGAIDDAQKLSHDFGVGVASTLDLRFMALLAGQKPEGLAKLTKNLLNVQLDKNWRLVCSDWEATELNNKQLNYAANDALVGVKIFEKLLHKIEPRFKSWFKKPEFNEIQTRLDPFIDIAFKESNFNKLSNLKDGNSDSSSNSKNAKIKNRSKLAKKMSSSANSKRTNFYHNNYLEAPDGELLCTIDNRKANWYLSQDLGVVVKTDPYTVRLNFEPAGRAVGETGKYYQNPKENRCVVCGNSDAYIRKNVVPREYRKYFPVVMKSHTSHDIVLLCPTCHQVSNISDFKIRKGLAEQCDAPLSGDGAEKHIRLPVLVKLKSAARALLYNMAQIPPVRVEELKNVLFDHYGKDIEINEELLEQLIDMDVCVDDGDYRFHGEKVVSKYQNCFGGLVGLEKLWREHFINTMHPKFLPPLWSVNHNANRLLIRAQEGRIEQDDMQAAGILFDKSS